MKVENVALHCTVSLYVQCTGWAKKSIGGLTIYFPIVYNMCQKLWKLASSRQSYCRNNQAYFFGPPCSIFLFAFRVCAIVMGHFNKSMETVSIAIRIYAPILFSVL